MAQMHGDDDEYFDSENDHTKKSMKMLLKSISKTYSLSDLFF